MSQQIYINQESWKTLLNAKDETIQIINMSVNHLKQKSSGIDLSAKIFEHIKNGKTILEKSPLEILSKKGELMAFKHSGFWQCMDTMRDKKYLSNMLKDKKAPWKT